MKRAKVYIFCQVIAVLMWSFTTQTIQAQDNLTYEVTITCTSCHSNTVIENSTIPFVHIGDSDLIESAMLAYKYDERIGTIMNRIAKGYSDAEITQLSKHLAANSEGVMR